MSNSIKFNTSEVFYIIKNGSIIQKNKKGSIIFVVGKSPIDIMEPIFV